MLDLNTINEFSRTYCVAICAFLVPVNLLLTLRTLVLIGIGRPQVQISRSAAIACIPALLMVSHVLSWLAIGVVMAPTYILLCLGSVCLAIDVWTIVDGSSIGRAIGTLRSKLS